MTCLAVILALVIMDAVVCSLWLRGAKARKPPKPTPPGPLVHPCTNWHFYEPIATRTLDGLPYACAHTSLLSRCRVCQQHKTEVYPGEYTLTDFTMPGAADLERAAR